MDCFNERIGFSAHLATFYLEFSRVSAAFCKERHSLTLTEYELLLTLLGAGRSLTFYELADFLVLRPGTLWHMAPSLLDRSLIVAECSRQDRRQASLRLTGKGAQVAASCNCGLTAYVKGMTQSMLPDDEYRQFLQTGIAASLDSLRGCAASASLSGELMPGQRVEFNVFVRVIIEKWRRCVRECADLSLNELRVLQALSEGPFLRMQDIADALLMTRSEVSACKKSLCGRGLACQKSNPFDGRSCLLGLTQKGRGVLRRCLPALDEITVPAHRPSTEESVMVLRAWHSRMYCNLKRARLQNT